MAKELPYFKFEPNQWENGNIQMCSREDKGLYIDLCSMYWSRLGNMPLKLAIQKLCGGNATALDSLHEEGIIHIIDDLISIDFLNEQLLEFEDTSKQNSKNAKLGWDKRRKTKELEDKTCDRNATALNPQSESDAIREEKRRQDKIKEDNRIERIKKAKAEFKNSLLPHLSKYGKKTLNDFYQYWTEHGENDKKMRFEKQTSYSIPHRLSNWVKNDFGKSYKDEAVTAVNKRVGTIKIG
jgi:hypothetical protein